MSKRTPEQWAAMLGSRDHAVQLRAARAIVRAVNAEARWPWSMRQAAERAGYTREDVLDAEGIIANAEGRCAS